MRKSLAAVVVFVLAACASSGSKGMSAEAVQLAKPGIRIVQTSGLPTAARHVDGAISVSYAVRVENNATDTITLRRVTVQSVGDGAYYVGPSSTPFQVAVAPQKHGDVSFWAPARAGDTMIGANGPVTLRVTCEFESAKGRFIEVVTRQVNERASIVGD
jgi:hypothetical protein